MTITDSTDATAEELRAHYENTIIDSGNARTEPVIAALRAVDRADFLPEATTADAYNPRIAVITKKDSDGRHLSCASVATLVFGMLEHLQVRPGDRVYECGAGTGYNAALLAELAGPDGTVTTVDIDPDVTDGAARALDRAGYSRVHVLTRDGALGAAEDAPFDRSIATVGVWDIPAPWFKQLKPGGRLVLPLRWRGQTRGAAFTKDTDGTLRSDAVFLCGFVPMIGQDGEHTAEIHTDPAVRIRFDADQRIEPTDLAGVLDMPKAQVWCGVTIGGSDPVDGIWLRATATDPAVCRIEASKEAVAAGICTPVIPNLSPVLVVGASLAYLAHRRVEGPESRFELGAIGHGSDGQLLAERLCDHIRTWNSDRDARPFVAARLATDVDRENLPAETIIKQDCVVTVVY